MAETENVTGITKDAADVLAQARLTEYCILSRDFSFSTTRSGLSAGQSALVYVPEMGIPVGNFFILQIKTTIKQNTDGSLWFTYDVDSSEGPDIGSWAKVFNVIA